MKILEDLRHKLNLNAELSGQEKETNRIINEFLDKTNPDVHLKNVGGYGIIAIYKGQETGKNILLRADIDGLNIPRGSQQDNETMRQQAECHSQYHSQCHSQCQSSSANSKQPTANSQYSHRCGHDGHATILCGLAMRLGERRPAKGDVILLFQPAEETGEGAAAVINDPQFRDMKIDAAYALHNLPSFERHQIVIKKDCFASASAGLKLIFDGKTSHASQPDKGNNPQRAVTTLLDAFQHPITVTHVVIGEETFGVTPGHAEIWITLRSQDDKTLQESIRYCTDSCNSISKDFDLKFSYSIHEAFSATINSSEEVDVVERAAKELRLSVNKIDDAFPWSEDFGRFGELCPSCLFGLGCGLEHEPLHSPTYDFEDEIIDTGVDVFEKIITFNSEP